MKLNFAGGADVFMYITSISLSYLFLIIGVFSIIAALYFYFIVNGASEESKYHDQIVGNMKDAETWKNSNKKMAYLFTFWAILSIAIFIYLKYFYGAALLSIFIAFIYAAVIIISSFIFSYKRSKA